MLREPLSGGTAQRYTASPDSVAAASRRALPSRRLRVVRDTIVDSTRLLVGKVGMTPFNYGELGRVAITLRGDDTEVRVISRAVNRLDVLHRNATPSLFRALDRELAGAGIGPFAGDRVRVVTSGPASTTLTGRVVAPRGSSGLLTLEVGGRPRTIPVGDISVLAISRGRYGHAKEGALLGVLVGGLVGGLAAPGADGSEFQGLARASMAILGAAVGVVAGGTAGSQIRTEVWGEVAPAWSRAGASRDADGIWVVR
jgi:hypothetical protein